MDFWSARKFEKFLERTRELLFPGEGKALFAAWSILLVQLIFLSMGGEEEGGEEEEQVAQERKENRGKSHKESIFRYRFVVCFFPGEHRLPRF